MYPFGYIPFSYANIDNEDVLFLILILHQKQDNRRIKGYLSVCKKIAIASRKDNNQKLKG